MHTEILITVVCLLGQITQPSAPSRTVSESVEVRYARAQMQLAEANLNRVQQSNKRVPRSVPSSVVAEYQRDLDVAKERLEQATAGRSAGEFQVWLQRAQAEQQTADTTWKNATAVNARAPGTFDPLDVERFRLRTEVAKLQLERGQTLVDAGREAQLQWEADLLDNQLQRLKEESSPTSPFIRLYPYWRR
jgi:exonuclease VII large subunit